MRMSLVWPRKGIPSGHNPPDFRTSTSENRGDLLLFVIQPVI